MSQSCLAVSSIATFLFAFNLIESASSGENYAAELRYQDHSPISEDSIIDKIAVSVAKNLLISPVLGNHAHFLVQKDQVHDMLFRVAGRFVVAAGYRDPIPAEIVAEAAQEVGVLNSRLYFYAFGYMFAKFLQTSMDLSFSNADYFALRIVSEIERVACSDGVFDSESTMNAVVYGITNMLRSYEWITYDNVQMLCRVFAEELKRLEGKY